MATETQSQEAARPGKARLWLARVGIAGFMFFLIKGLLWLVVPALIAYQATS